MKFSKAKIFLFCLLFFIAGLSLAGWLPEGSFAYGLLWFFLLCSSLVLITLNFSNKKIIKIALLGLFFFLGGWRYSLSQPDFDRHQAAYYNGNNVIIRGEIDNLPAENKSSQSFVVSAREIESGLAKEKVKGKILVYAELFVNYSYGEKLELSCELNRPKDFSDFSYTRYLGKSGIYSVCYFPKIETFSKNENVFWQKIYSLRKKAETAINENLNYSEAGLLKAILLGDKKDIPEAVREGFSRLGLSHIVAVSGLHISILTLLLMGFLVWIGFWRRTAFYIAGLLLFFYIILIGAPASAVRAGIMGFLVLLAYGAGRLNRSVNALLLSAFVLLLINPRLLRDDIGFQLSFLAVLGIIYFYPVLNDCLDKLKIPKLGGLRDIVNISLAAQIFTWPLVVYYFGVISFVSPLANLLVLWTLPALLISSIAAVISALLWPGISFIFFLPVKIIVFYIFKIVETLKAVPGAYKEIYYLDPVFLAFYYILIFAIIIKMNKNKI